MSNPNINLPKNKVASKLKYSDIDEAYKNLSYSDDNQNFIGLEFILLDGPPYANGDLHIGHIINRTIKDIIVRYYALRGKKICYILGWDCHGLPIEAKAVQELKINKIYKDNAIRQIVNAKSLEIMQYYADKQLTSLKNNHMFTYCNKYYTHSISYITETLNTVWKLVKQKYIQYQKKPNYYSLAEKTNLAFAEIVYQDKKDMSLVFMVTINNTEYNLLVWTTQPWTILGNEFIGINPKITYCLAMTNTDKQVICSLAYAEKQGFVILEKALDTKWLMRQSYTMLGTTKNIIDASNIVSTDGTSILHIAPAHGFEDFDIAINNNFDIRNIQNCVNEDGYAIDSRFSQYSLNDNSLNKAIVEYLTSQNKVFKLGEIEHRYPFSSRSKTPVYILSTYQAMILITDVDKATVINKFSKSNWCASEGFETYKSVIEQRPSFWCITRQRFWGIPCMLIIDDNYNIIYNTELNKLLLDCINKYEFSFWYDDEFMYGLLKTLNLEAYTHTRVKCVLDVWFESGIAGIHLTQTEGQNALINQIHTIVEGRDQHRGWFSSIGLINEITKSGINVNNIVVHGFACYAKSMKVSKSDSNSIKKTQAILADTYTEIIRLSIFISDFIQDIIINEDSIKQAEKLYLNIYSILRFFINMSDFQITSIEYNQAIGDIDKIIYYRFMTEYQKFKKYIEQNKINELSKPFIAALEYANEYIRVSKDQLYCNNQHTPKVQSILAIMDTIFITFIKMLYCICPGLAMYLMQHKVPHINSEYRFVHFLSRYISIDIKESENNKLWDEIYHMYKLINIRLDFHKKNKIVASNYEIDIIIFDKSNIISKLDSLTDDICRVMDVTNIIYTNRPLDPSHMHAIIDTLEYQGITIYLRKISAILYKCPRCWKYNSLAPQQMCTRCNNAIKPM